MANRKMSLSEAIDGSKATDDPIICPLCSEEYGVERVVARAIVLMWGMCAVCRKREAIAAVIPTLTNYAVDTLYNYMEKAFRLTRDDNSDPMIDDSVYTTDQRAYEGSLFRTSREYRESRKIQE